MTRAPLLVAAGLLTMGCERNPPPRPDKPPAHIAELRKQLKTRKTRPRIPPPTPPLPRPVGTPQSNPDFADIAKETIAGRAIGKPGTPPIERLDDGRIRIGRVVVDRNLRTVSMPGHVAIDAGILEFFAVSEKGRDYESVIVVHAVPSHVHLGLVLVGLAPAEIRRNQTGAAEVVKEGDRVRMTIAWTDPKTEEAKETRSMSLLRHRKTREAPTEADWIFMGSGFFRGEYAADSALIVASLIPDGAAVIAAIDDQGNPYQGADLGYEINKEIAPPKDTPITLIIQPASG